ncbi:MAG TPA: hypothetical protein VM491_13125 [Burkholderiaceae bacterium]|jgi:hypothetical protein|nr:hypothetical protein [Burkholderiaceae bacterium]
MDQIAAEPRAVPLALRLATTAFVAVLVPVYAAHYGFWHFLWLSDVGLFLTLAALWLRSRLLISMMGIGLLPLELYWNLEFLLGLLAGIELAGLAGYMFDDDYGLLLRGLSLFHVALPPIWIWLLHRWRYDPRALWRQTALLWGIVLATWAFTDPQQNINWVWTAEKHLDRFPQPLWVLAYALVLPLAVHWPMHALLQRVVPMRRLSSDTLATGSDR